MKKIVPVIWLSVLVLSGCGVPFMGNEKEEAVQFINTNANVINASDEIDELLRDTLKNAEKYEFAKMMTDVRKTKELQNDLYESIENDVLNGEYAPVKRMYLDYINQRKASYNVLIATLGKENYDTLALVVAEYEVKDRELREKTIEKVNIVLETIGEEKRKSLTEKPKEEKK